jgi:hypothetical protein
MTTADLPSPPLLSFVDQGISSGATYFYVWHRPFVSRCGR